MNLLEKLEHTEGCVLRELDPLLKAKYHKLIPDQLPDDLTTFLKKYNSVDIFPNEGSSPPHPNSWSLGSRFFSASNTVASFFGPPDPENAYMAEYYESFYLLGNSGMSGSDIIGVSNHPDSRGMIFFYYIASTGAPVGMPKIADSFTEWVERTLAAGPDARNAYWGEPDFIDLGPAIPNDPYYKPFGRLP